MTLRGTREMSKVPLEVLYLAQSNRRKHKLIVEESKSKIFDLIRNFTLLYLACYPNVDKV